MNETCSLCGSELKDGDTLLKLAIKGALDSESRWAKGWDAVWSKWNVGGTRSVGGFVVTKVFESNPDDLDGYDEVELMMVFEVEGKGLWKVEGTWSSQDGKEWVDVLVPAEKKERVQTYYE